MKYTYSNKLLKKVPDYGSIFGMSAYCIVARYCDHIYYNELNYSLLLYLPLNEIPIGTPASYEDLDQLLDYPFDTLSDMSTKKPNHDFEYIRFFFEGVDHSSPNTSNFLDNIKLIESEFNVSIRTDNVHEWHPVLKGKDLSYLFVDPMNDAVNYLVSTVCLIGAAKLHLEKIKEEHLKSQLLNDILESSLEDFAFLSIYDIVKEDLKLIPSDLVTVENALDASISIISTEDINDSDKVVYVREKATCYLAHYASEAYSGNCSRILKLIFLNWKRGIDLNTYDHQFLKRFIVPGFRFIIDKPSFEDIVCDDGGDIFIHFLDIYPVMASDGRLFYEILLNPLLQTDISWGCYKGKDLQNGIDDFIIFRLNNDEYVPCLEFLSGLKGKLLKSLGITSYPFDFGDGEFIFDIPRHGKFYRNVIGKADFNSNTKFRRFISDLWGSLDRLQMLKNELVTKHPDYDEWISFMLNVHSLLSNIEDVRKRAMLTMLLVLFQVRSSRFDIIYDKRDDILNLLGYYYDSILNKRLGHIKVLMNHEDGHVFALSRDKFDVDSYLFVAYLGDATFYNADDEASFELFGGDNGSDASLICSNYFFTHYLGLIYNLPNLMMYNGKLIRTKEDTRYMLSYVDSLMCASESAVRVQLYDKINKFTQDSFTLFYFVSNCMKSDPLFLDKYYYSRYDVKVRMRKKIKDARIIDAYDSVFDSIDEFVDTYFMWMVRYQFV